MMKTDEETEAQSCKVTCPKMLSWAARSLFGGRQSCSRTRFLMATVSSRGRDGFPAGLILVFWTGICRSMMLELRK